MAGLKFALGLIPKTDKVEETDNKLRKDFQEYREIEKSDELKRFHELEKEVNSTGFAAKKKEILSKKYKNTGEYATEKEFRKLEKSKAIRNYFKVKDSRNLEEYKSFQTSDIKKRMDELENFMRSDAIAKAKANLSPKEYKNSEEAAKEREYLQLLKSPQVKKIRKFEKSAAFNEYKRVEESGQLKRYKELKENVNTEKFKEFKEYMNLPGKKKYILSDEYKKEVEYKELRESERIQWYFKVKKKYPFREIEKWELVLEENFDESKPDSKKWIHRYINGDKLIGMPYVLADDQHAFTDGKNVEVIGSHLSIITRQEKASSFTWSPLTGFTEKEFDFTSDMISSGKSHKFKYGLFKAKVKIGPSDVTQAFSLMADQMLPHIDIFRYDHKKLLAGSFCKNGSKTGFTKSVEKTGGSRYTRDFFIYSLEWKPGKLTWKINDVPFKVQSQGIPEADMHIVFNASLKNYAKAMGLPSRLEIDWIRVYREKAAE